MKLVAEGPAQDRAENELVLRVMEAMSYRDYAKALGMLEPMTFTSRRTFDAILYAQALLGAGRTEDAIKALEWLLSKDARLGLGGSKPHALVTLARQHAKLGHTAEARRRYQEFFEFWKTADPDLPILVEAKAEFAKLGS
jgi:hypothetical protein